MADLVEIAFPSEEKAEQVRQKLIDMQKEYLIELGAVHRPAPRGGAGLGEAADPVDG